MPDQELDYLKPLCLTHHKIMVTSVLAYGRSGTLKLLMESTFTGASARWRDACKTIHLVLVIS